jgi:hypothetical protein
LWAVNFGKQILFSPLWFAHLLWSLAYLLCFLSIYLGVLVFECRDHHPACDHLQEPLKNLGSSRSQEKTWVVLQVHWAGRSNRPRTRSNRLCQWSSSFQGKSFIWSSRLFTPRLGGIKVLSPTMSGAATDARATHVPEVVRHFFIPHPQFMHGLTSEQATGPEGLWARVQREFDSWKLLNFFYVIIMLHLYLGCSLDCVFFSLLTWWVGLNMCLTWI